MSYFRAQCCWCSDIFSFDEFTRPTSKCSTKSKRHMELVGGMGHWMFSLSDSRNGNGFGADFDLFITSILFFPAGREVGGGGASASHQ